VNATYRELPILFSGEMVRAIREGRKTQTRRVINPQPTEDLRWSGWVISSSNKKHVGCASWETQRTIDTGFSRDDGLYIKCPYGNPGDQLWVRETWRIVGWHDGEPLLLEYKDGVQMEEPGDSSDYDENKYMQYYIDCSDDMNRAGVRLDVDKNEYRCDEYGSIPTRWRSSIFMPRWASRIQLEVISIKVERVQDVTEDDAKAEGVWGLDEPYQGVGDLPTDRFRDLWDSINGNRKDKSGKLLPYSWEDNPWVFVVEFERIKP